MERRQFVLCGGVLASLPLLACGDDGGGSSGSNSGGTASGSGGDNTATGGDQNGSGGTQNGSGGTQNQGGASSGGNDNNGSGGTNGGDETCTQDIEGDSSFDAGHTHPFTLELSDIQAGEEVTLLLETAGAQPHTHEVTLTADDLAKLRAGETVERESDGLHTHTVTLSCAE